MKPRHWVHRGRVLTRGFWIDPELIGESAARRRLIARWTAGCRVVSTLGGYAIILPHAERVEAQTAPGAPLVEAPCGFIAAPLTEKEQEAVQDHHGMIGLVQAQTLEFRHLEDAQPIDPSQWLDLSAYPQITTESLAPPPPPIEAAELTPVDLRTQLDVPPMADAAKVMIASLEQDAQPKDAETEASNPESTSKPSWLNGLLSRLGRWVARLGQQFSKGAPPTAAHSDASSTSEFAEGPAASETGSASWWQRMGHALKRFGLKLAFRTRLAQTFQRRQAEYLAELFNMFEDGDLDNALRHAIPLSTKGLDNSDLPSLSRPKPRDNLHLAPHAPTRSGGAVPLGPNLFEHLRAQYRRAFERLRAEGRIDEAAFVLAELLEEIEEAIDFLENHDRARLAAELAENHRLPPARIIRQWIVAGDWDRALRIARRHRAFSEAIAILGNKLEQEAKTLRWMWAQSLTTAGDFVGAIDVLWPVENLRSHLGPLIDQGLDVGGPPGARMLVKAILLFPERFSDLRERIQTLLDDDTPEASLTRNGLAEALIEPAPTPETRLLAKATLRALYRDAHAPAGRASKATVNRLIEITNDPVFRSDLVAMAPTGRDFAQTQTEVEVHIGMADAGNIAIEAAVALSKQRFLVAMGEAGCAVVSARGQLLKRFSVPAHDLVLSDYGHRAIAVARRGRWCRLARVDLVHQRATSWCEAELSTYAHSFDGWQWLVAARPDGALEALDVLEEGLVSQWRNRDCSPLRITRGAPGVGILHAIAGELAEETWHFDPEQMTLRARTPVPKSQDLAEWVLGPSARGEIVMLTKHDQHLGQEDENGEPTLLRTYRVTPIHGSLPPFSAELPPAIEVTGHALEPPWLILVTREIDQAVVRVFHLEQRRIRLRMTLGGAWMARVRFAGPVDGQKHHRFTPHDAVVWDDRGRIFVIDLRRGMLTHSVRIRI